MTVTQDPYIESLKNEITTLRAELEAEKAQVDVLYETLKHIKNDGCNNFDDPGDCYIWREVPCPACIASAAIDTMKQEKNA